jgi:hypothetical protein
MRLRLFLLLLLLAGLVVLGSPAGAAAEAGCANEAVRQMESAAHPEGFASGLADCRAFEQVTPVEKDGTNPAGFEDGVRASVAGDRVVFDVPANMPGADGAEAAPFFLGSRGGEGWSDRGLTLPRDSSEVARVIGWTEDLSEAVGTIGKFIPGEELVLSVYLRDSATGSFQFGFQAPPVSIFIPALSELFFVGSSGDDSRMLFETEVQLSPSAAAGRMNLYELHDGVVSLVSVLPDGSAPAEGSFAGPYDWLGSQKDQGGVSSHYYTEGAISRDGSRVFFTTGGTGQIYVRENGSRTVPVGVGAFLAATPDGSRMFYLAGGAGGDLVEFDVASEQTTVLTPGGGVEGLLGVSDDGSYVYFAANGGGIYLSHAGTIGFVATAGGGDWSPRDYYGGQVSPRVSRVSSDGRFLLFTGLDGQLDRYDAVHGRLACVSCAPSGVPPSSPASLRSITIAASQRVMPILLRNLSSDGSRVFFESPDALLPRDTNGVQDVYEWEQQGAGSCQGNSESFSAASGGCLYLVSSGTSPEKSFFADASASGNDVFFFTDQPLVGQDQDGLVDVYDARVGGGLVGQNPSAAPVACEGEGCKPAAGSAPVFGAPVSTTFTGAGNQTPPPPAVTAPKPKAKHKTVKPRHKKKRRARKARRAVSGAGVRGAIRGGK